MTYVLMFCVFMSSSGESCTDIARYPTIDACVDEANNRIKREGPNENYKCEGRKR